MIVLDTSAWLWWTTGSSRLAGEAGRAIRRASRVVVPAICCWEVALLVDQGRIRLDRTSVAWLRAALAQPRVELAPLTADVAAQAVLFRRLAGGDPADDLVAATAWTLGAPLATSDARLRAIPGLKTVW